MSTQSLGQGGGVSKTAQARSTASIKDGARVEIEKELSAITGKRLTTDVGEVKEMLTTLLNAVNEVKILLATHGIK